MKVIISGYGRMGHMVEDGTAFLHAEGEEEELPAVALEGEVHGSAAAGSSSGAGMGAAAGSWKRGWRREGSRAWLRR